MLPGFQTLRIMGTCFVINAADLYCPLILSPVPRLFSAARGVVVLMEIILKLLARLSGRRQ